MLVVPSVTSSESPLSSLNASLVSTWASTYVLTANWEGIKVFEALPKAVSVSIAACTLKSALASV